MSTKKKTNTNDTRIVLKNVRLSYVSLTTPKESEREDGSKVMKYSVQILMPKTGKYAKANEALLDNAIAAAKEKGKTKLANKNGIIPASLKTCKRDGDEDETYAGEKIYEGMWVVNASNPKKPGLVDVQLQPIMDEEEIYSGIWAYVSINVAAFTTDKSKGITAYINNVMKLRNDERLDGAISAEKEFEGVEVDDDLTEDIDSDDEKAI